MTPMLVRTYDHFATAEAARNALLEQGFDRDAIELTVLHDEAGPAEGNFVSGNGAVSTGGNTAFQPEPPSDEPYEQNFQPVRDRASHLLRVAITSDDARRRAESTLEPFGGIDVERNAPST